MIQLVKTLFKFQYEPSRSRRIASGYTKIGEYCFVLFIFFKGTHLQIFCNKKTSATTLVLKQFRLTDIVGGI